MPEPISATVPDWSRETARKFWDPSRKLLRALRGYQRARNPLTRRLWHMRFSFWCWVAQVDIAPQTEIGGGLILPHPNGIVIHSATVIGPNCLIFQQVTLGARGLDGVPHIGGHVDIGAGARILGPVRIGDHAVIGANAVVICDVPPGHVARGVPARVYPRRDVP
ncbi:MAG: serine acetyltransferase [Rhodobacteraceae bacterium]|nr:MAG: serine acetyltransferase [Paracoccaceae bacterium]